MQNQFVDLYRNGIKNATDIMRAGLETTAQLQQKHLEFVRTVLDENSRSASQLGEARSVEDLVALQSRMAGAQFERMTEYWSNFWRDTYALAARTSEQASRSAGSQMTNLGTNVGSALRDAASQQPQSERKGQDQHQHQHRKSA